MRTTTTVISIQHKKMLKVHSFVHHVVKRYSYKKIKPGLFLRPVQRNQALAKNRALEHFDDFYKSVFGPKWKRIRAALLTEHKFAAIVNNFGDVEDTKTSIEYNGAVNMRNVFEVFKNDDDTTPQDFDSPKWAIEERLSAHLQWTQKDEIRSIYNKGAEEELEKLALENATEPSRTIVKDVVDYKKSLQQSMAEDAEYDFDRMISAEMGVIGLHEFIPATKLKGMEEFVLESDHYRYYNPNVEIPVKFEPEESFRFPKSLDVYIYAKHDISRFSRPKITSTGALSHLLVDGASVLPPLLLNLDANDKVLDVCAATGARSLVILQTLLPELLVCNEQDYNKHKQIGELFKQHLPDYTSKWKDSKVVIKRLDPLELDQFDVYDKILVDVPCTNDRLSVHVNHDNIFKGNRIKERIRLPESQSAILAHSLRLLKPGGSLIYSTSSLSPVQNDGVVNMALSRAFQEHNISCTIIDLTAVLKPLAKLYTFMPANEMKFGQLVVPFLIANHGPLYISKIRRDS